MAALLDRAVAPGGVAMPIRPGAVSNLGNLTAGRVEADQSGESGCCALVVVEHGGQDALGDMRNCSNVTVP